MNNEPNLRKPDRYKLCSFHAYNTKMPGYYDSAYFIKLFKVELWYQTIVNSLLPQAANTEILDVGCGTGTLLAELGKSGAAFLSGVDLAEGILNDAEKKLTELNIKADLHTADAEDHIPWDDNKFDIVTMTGTLHHFYRPLDVLSEISRVMKPNGRLIVIDPCFLTPVRQIINLYLKIFPHDGDYRFYSSEHAQKLLTEAGFNIQAAKRVGLWAYFIEALCYKNK
ncbi:class I SAM-dependent methyltransferase [Bacteroidota bacterium]